MSQPTPSLEQRVEQLEQQVAELQQSVQHLYSSHKLPSKSRQPLSKRQPATGGSEEILSWVDKSLILPRLASTSFIVVVALALRTSVENGLFDRELGSFLGMLYAIGLIVYGWFAYRRQNMQAPVFTLWGTIVICSVVVEAHRVFASVPAELAYLILAATGAVTTIMSRTNQVALPVFCGTLGMSFGAFAIDYPSPHFPYLTLVIILANVFGAYATSLLRASWLRWVLLVLTLFMIQIWDLKLAIYLSKLQPDQLDVTISGFFPAISLLLLAYVIVAFLGVRGFLQEKVSKFDISLPIVSTLWFALAGSYATRLGLAEPYLFGWLGALGGILMLALGFWLLKAAAGGALGTVSFCFAGGLLLLFSLPSALGHSLIAYALCSLLALIIGRLALRHNCSTLRLCSYLLQMAACTALVVTLSASELYQPSLVGAVSSGVLAIIAFTHYAWARANPFLTANSFVDKLNQNDRWGGFLLISALLSGFFTCRVGLYQVLDFMHMAKPSYFAGAQSVMINLSAAALLLFGYFRRNKELRNVAIIITVIGGAKVFVFDMVSLKGISLMAGVFSFGLVAALGSFVLGRWNKANPSPD